MRGEKEIVCPDCDADPVSRRDFLRVAGGVAGGVAAVGAFPAFVSGSEKRPVAETYAKDLYDSLSSDQKKEICFDFNAPLRSKISANWAITEPRIEDYTPKQQDLIERIVRGLSSEEGFEKFMKQMGDDDGGLGSYHVAIFGKPGDSRFEFELTGRHATMRADGNSVEGVAFGGPMVYGHAASGFTEKVDHPGNVFWYQGKRANEVFAALDPKQRKQALIEQAPEEDAVQHRKSGYPGLAVGDMSSDQKELVHKVMSDLLSPYREQDVKEVMDLITANGGLEKIHLSFYKLAAGGKDADIGSDGVWDIWRLEGPGFVWHFRGYPHVHTYVNIAKVG